MPLLALALAALAVVGMLLLGVQLAALILSRRRAARAPTAFPRVTILKPLCGVDEDLRQQLAHFAALDYPDYELLLGVETMADAAWPLALEAEKRWPGRVRAFVQRGVAGLNPKVNQLASLAARATGEIFVISDSNATMPSDFLREIAAHFEDPSVGLVAHPVVGSGEESLGAQMDTLHLASIGLGCVAAKTVAGQDLVVGKTMSLRRSDVAALGGFESVANVLAEDFVLGRRVSDELGKRVALAQGVVESISRRRTVRSFFDRYARWSVMQHAAVGTSVYLGQLLLNPLPFAILALCVAPSVRHAVLVAATALVRTLVDGASVALLRRRNLTFAALVASPLKDLVIAAAWLHGLTHASVLWRGHRLHVRPGTLLVPAERLDFEPARLEANSVR